MPRKKNAKKTAQTKRLRNHINQKQEYQKIVTKRNVKKTPEQLRLLTNPPEDADNPMTFNRLMEWLAWTGWVEGYIRKRISPMDVHLIEDYTQSIWVKILTLKQDVMLEVWSHGKGQFVNYIKKVIDLQLAVRTDVYKENKHFHHTHAMLSDEQWKAFEEGDIHSTEVTSYPEKCMCPTGNRKKMIVVEHDIKDIMTEKEYIVEE